MKKLISILFLFVGIFISAFGQASNGKFEMIIHNSNSNVQLYGYNAWIDQTTFGNWATIVDGKYYISNTFEQALQVFFITKLKRVRTFAIGNNQDTLLQVIYFPTNNVYSVIARNNYSNPYMFNDFYSTSDFDGTYGEPVSVRGMINEFLIECVRGKLLYEEY